MINATAQSHATPQEGEFPVALVPRINIHTFCDNQQTAETLQAAAFDRRMSRAHVTIQMGGIVAAVQVFQTQPTPNVLVVESHSSRDRMLAELAQLAQVCGADTRVVVIGHLNDVILYRELVRQGVSEYLVAPLDQLQIIETVASLYRDPKSEPLGRIVTFVGAKGGVGSSTLAHNFGWDLSHNHAIDTVITDLDLAFGTAGLDFNQDSQGIADALGQPDRIDQTLIDRLLTKCGDKLSLLAPRARSSAISRSKPERSRRILSVVRHNVPYVVVDVPSMWAPWIKYTLIHADDVVITATPDLASLRNTKNIFDILKVARANDKPPMLILNQVGMQKRPEIPPAEFGKALGIEPSLIIAHDPHTFGTASSNGQMLSDVAPKSKTAEMLTSFAQIIAGNEVPGKAGKAERKSLFKFPSLRKK